MRRLLFYIFPFSLPSPIVHFLVQTASLKYSKPYAILTKQSTTLQFRRAFVSLVDFQIACKMMSRLSAVAGTQDSKPQNYTTFGLTIRPQTILPSRHWRAVLNTYFEIMFLKFILENWKLIFFCKSVGNYIKILI